MWYYFPYCCLHGQWTEDLDIKRRSWKAKFILSFYQVWGKRNGMEWEEPVCFFLHQSLSFGKLYIFERYVGSEVYILFYYPDPTVGFWSGYLMNTYEVELSNKEAPGSAYSYQVRKNRFFSPPFHWNYKKRGNVANSFFLHFSKFRSTANEINKLYWGRIY